MPEVTVIATLSTGSLFGVSEAFARFRVFAGESWNLLEGEAFGQTQTAIRDPISDVLTWTHPVELHYVCTSLAGWPRIAVTVWQVDAHGRNEVAGYGVAFIPPSPGVHVVDVACWRPEGSTLQELGGECDVGLGGGLAFRVQLRLLRRVTAWFRGGVPQLTDTQVLLGSAQRHSLATVTTGTCQVCSVPMIECLKHMHPFRAPD